MSTTYTQQEYPILRRYHIGTHPLRNEKQSTKLQAPAQFKANLVKRYVAKHAAELDEQKVACYFTKQKLKELDVTTDINYAHEFMLWLQGRSQFNRKPLTWWETNNLFHLQDVVPYLKQATTMRLDYLRCLNMLAKFGPVDMQQAELYFKYIVLEHHDRLYETIDGMLHFLDHFYEASGPKFSVFA